jgi:hypothetical protein
VANITYLKVFLRFVNLNKDNLLNYSCSSEISGFHGYNTEDHSLLRYCAEQSRRSRRSTLTRPHGKISQKTVIFVYDNVQHVAVYR